MSTERYDEFVRGADPRDRPDFDSFLIGWLLNAVDEEARTTALEGAAAFVNGGAR